MSNDPLADLVRAGESGKAGYGAYNRGTYNDEHGVSHMRPMGTHVDVTQLTIDEIQRRQSLRSADPDRLFAVGAYQVIPETLNNAVTRLSLDTKQKLSPELQDHIFADHLIVNKRSAVHAYITDANGSTLQAAQTALAKEWASIGDPVNKGMSHYGKPNQASIALAQTEAALNQMRETYHAGRDKGLSPEQAWKAVTGVDSAQVQGRRQEASQAPAVGEVHATPTGSLRKGDHGEAVRNLQVELNEHLHARSGHRLQVDGQFGPATGHAVTTFQRQHDLVADGIVGAYTRHALAEQAHASGRIQPTQERAPAPVAPAVREGLAHDMFERVYAAVATRTEEGLAAVARVYGQTAAGQAWLKQGQADHQQQVSAQSAAQQQAPLRSSQRP